jgi:hypothetical protein
MSMFDSSDYRWRETYFVLFDAAKRPHSDKVRAALKKLGRRFELGELHADADGGFESITLSSPSDYAALDISYLSGDEVRLNGAALADELKGSAADETERAKIARLRKCDARFDVMHFEQVSDAADAESEMFDPSALLVVIETLTELTDGVGVDPQSGTVF